MLTHTALDATARTRPQDIQQMALFILAQAKQAGLQEGVSTTQLRQSLSSVVRLSPEDKEVTAGDTVSRFDRTILNFVSHNRLVKDRLARYATVGSGASMRITMKGQAVLFDQMLGLIGGDLPMTDDEPKGQRDERTGERAIALSALLMLAREQAANEGRGISTSTWKAAIKNVVPTSPEDREILKGRKDTRFDQVIRNLISNKTLLNEGLMKRDSEGLLSITNRGKARLLQEILTIMPVPGFIQQAKAQKQAPRRPHP
jgi:hypothetical protein